jgi:outer membrane lipoprotein SlyB
MKAGSAESGFIRISPLAAGVAVSVMIVSLIGVDAVTGMFPRALSQKQNDLSQRQDDARAAGSEPRAVALDRCALCGAIESIRVVEVRDETKAVGTAGGFTGAAGDMDKGNADAAATVLGAVVGVFAGNETDKKTRRVYRVTVRMDDGSFRTVSLSSPPAFAVGEKVRVVEGKLVRA